MAVVSKVWSVALSPEAGKKRKWDEKKIDVWLDRRNKDDISDKNYKEHLFLTMGKPSKSQHGILHLQSSGKGAGGLVSQVTRAVLVIGPGPGRK